MIYFSSDLHFCHDREFIYKPRGFNSVDEMNEAIVERFNSVLTEEDTLYLLGDEMLNDNEKGLEYLSKINAKLVFIIGNHDTDSRINLYKTLSNASGEILFATRLKYGKYHFYLSHYPTITSNLEKESLKECMINLYGHTHQQTNFYNDMPFMYHVGVDSHNCYPISIEQIIEDCKAKVEECREML